MSRTRGSILLVDDEAKIRNALAEALREEGHEVVAVGSPREAQRLLARGTFDVLLVDNLMPEMTGIDLLRKLRAAETMRVSMGEPVSLAALVLYTYPVIVEGAKLKK